MLCFAEARWFGLPVVVFCRNKFEIDVVAKGKRNENFVNKWVINRAADRKTMFEKSVAGDLYLLVYQIVS